VCLYHHLRRAVHPAVKDIRPPIGIFLYLYIFDNCFEVGRIGDSFFKFAKSHACCNTTLVSSMLLRLWAKEDEVSVIMLTPNVSVARAAKFAEMKDFVSQELRVGCFCKEDKEEGEVVEHKPHVVVGTPEGVLARSNEEATFFSGSLSLCCMIAIRASFKAKMRVFFSLRCLQKLW
jgi:hypothetical protein